MNNNDALFIAEQMLEKINKARSKHHAIMQMRMGRDADLLVKAADWSEDKHPRAEDGKFGNKTGGGEAPKSSKVTAESWTKSGWSNPSGKSTKHTADTKASLKSLLDGIKSGEVTRTPLSRTSIYFEGKNGDNLLMWVEGGAARVAYVKDGERIGDIAGSMDALKDEAGLPKDEPKPAPKAKKYEFKEQPTVKALNAHITQITGKPCDYKGVAGALANQWSKHLIDTFNEFPEVADRFDMIGSNQGRGLVQKERYTKEVLADNKDMFDKAGWDEDRRTKYVARVLSRRLPKTPSNTWALAYNQGSADGVFLNANFEAPELEKGLKRGTETKFHPVGCDTIRSIVDHEVGHMLDHMLSIGGDKEFREIFNSLGDVRSKTSIRGDVERKTATTDQLSTYAFTNTGEFIAEAWAEYKNNPPPRPVAKAVGDLIMKKYNEYASNKGRTK